MNENLEKRLYHLALYHSDSDKKDWHKREQLSENEIKTIAYSTNARFESGLNSIPSPFARLHLVDTAFGILSEDGVKTNEDTIYHKIVSYTLDVLEILFRRTSLSGQVSIKSLSISELDQFQLGHPIHNLLRDTLDLYLDSDFNGLDKFYLVYFENKLIGVTSPYTIISPSANLFITESDKKSDEQLKRINEYKICDRHNGLFQLDNHVFFKESGIKSLLQRREDFIEFVYKFANLHNLGAVESASNFWAYLTKVRPLVQDVYPELYNTISELDATTVQRSFHLSATGVEDAEAGAYRRLVDAENNPVQFSFLNDVSANDASDSLPSVVKVTLFTGDEEFDIPQSDFEMVSTKFTGDKVPLVLQRGFRGDAKYLSERWDDAMEVPYFRDLHPDINKRVLPDGYEYPFLVEGDFLEDYIVQLPYTIDQESFYTPSQFKHYDAKKGMEYLLPLKRKYFEYFDLSELDKYLSIEVSQDQNRREVVYLTLKVPIATHEYIIEFKKWYYVNPGIKGDMIEDGKIIKSQVDLGVAPIYRVETPDSPEEAAIIDKKCNSFFKIMLVDQDRGFLKDKKGALKFYSFDSLEEDIHADEKLDVRSRQKKKEKGGLGLSSDYYELAQKFDLIELYPANQGFSDNGAQDLKRYFSGSYYKADTRGLIIPKWREVPMKDGVFNFSIDFGTTNTHIAFKESDRKAAVQDFNYSIAESPVAILRKDSQLSSNPGVLIQNTEFLPRAIGRGAGLPFHFPIRTVICENQDFITSGSRPSLFGNVNIGFNYEKQIALEQSSYVTDLKWKGNLEGKDSDRVELFFEEVLLLIKIKIIAQGGDIAKSRVVWSYPLSMGRTSRKRLAEMWEKAYRKVFLGGGDAPIPRNFTSINESVAPYYYLKYIDELKDEMAEMVNVDIGGETVDVLFLEKGQPLYNTSFRFGANKLWGEGFSRIDHNDNGFIQNYIDHRASAAISIESEFREYMKTRAGMLTILKQILELPSGSKENFELSGSQDVISFLFNFEEELNARVTFSDSVTKALRMKSLLYIHFSAIVYHLAQTINHMNSVGHSFKAPRNLIFTGNGSKYLNMLGTKDELEELSVFIFNKVCGDNQLPRNFQLIFPDRPKEVTANGGVMAESSDLKEGLIEHKRDRIKNIIFPGNMEGHTMDELLPTQKKSDPALIDDIEDDWSNAGRYNEASEENQGRVIMSQVVENDLLRKSVLNNIKEFYKLIRTYKHLPSKDWINFDDEMITKVLKNHMADGYKAGLRRQADEKAIYLEETLFFYPLIQCIYELSKELTNEV